MVTVLSYKCQPQRCLHQLKDDTKFEITQEQDQCDL